MMVAQVFTNKQKETSRQQKRAENRRSQKS